MNIISCKNIYTTLDVIDRMESQLSMSPAKLLGWPTPLILPTSLYVSFEVFEVWVKMQNWLEFVWSWIMVSSMYLPLWSIISATWKSGSERRWFTLTTLKMTMQCPTDQNPCELRTIYQPLSKNCGPFGRMKEQVMAGFWTIQFACTCINERH